MNDYVDFCNEAYDAEKAAQGYLAKLSLEQMLHLRSFVREQHDAEKDDVSPAQKFLAAMLDEEIAERERNPHRLFEDAILTFVTDTDNATTRLVSALSGLSDEEWNRSADVMANWTERRVQHADAYLNAIERTVYERGRVAAEKVRTGDLPF